MSSAKRIYLNAFEMACVGHQAPGLWRHPDDQAHRYTQLSYWTELARLLDRGGFDALFLADVLGVYDVYEGSHAAAVREATQVPLLDPLPLVGAMAAVTERLGFGVTVSLTYEQPYALARRLTTLDHLTGGRVAWNVVTSYLESAARNLGFDAQRKHDDRYDVGDEFLDVVYQLWEYSWDDDAVVRDAARGVFTDPDKVRPIDHHGRYYDVPGIFLSEPSPQRTPVIFQAGASTRGRAFAAKHGEAIFINAVDVAATRRLVDDIRARVAEGGRDPASVKIFILLTAIAGETDAEAEAKLADYYAHASIDGALALYGGWSGLDLSGHDPDTPLAYQDTDAARSALEIFTKADPTRTWTPREVARYLTLGGIGPVVAGSPTTIADELERWVDASGVDGFNLAYAVAPGTFEDFVALVVPELRRRGRIPDAEDAGAALSLRERLTGSGPHVADGHPAAVHRARRLAAGGAP
ncbi:LLM class flavin-dependent oxidoreductase, partial [Conexibacter sp. JD483]|uniref:LLM class flavin-dependent oxidoreductase n=2 Tax=Conexibacter TaxID=191494 RepID=UPI00287032D4